MLDMLLSLLKGLPASVGITLGAFVLGMVLGVPLVLMRRAKFWMLRLVARAYVDVVRGVPPIVWLFILFFGIGSGSFKLSGMAAAILCFGIVSAAYISEIYRGGFMAVAKGQEEAVKALGMTGIDGLRFVIAPQVLRVSIPALATFLVSMLKDTAVASTVGVRDIMMFAGQEAQAAGGGFMPFVLAGVLYIGLSIPVAWFARVMDKKLRAKVSK